MKFSKWNIYHADLDPVVGSEQGKPRPVLIISEDEFNRLLSIVNILPITTRKEGRRIYPNEVFLEAGKYGLSNESIILCHQIRTIDKRRITKEYGSIDSEQKREEIFKAIIVQLGIPHIFSP